MDHTKLLEQINIWYANDEEPKIIEAILAIPEKDRGYALIGLLSMVYNFTGYYAEALQHILTIEEEGKADPKWHYCLGYAYNGLGKQEEAISSFSKAIQVSPEYSPAYMLRGNIYFKLERYKEAIQDYEQTIKLDPSNTDAQIGRKLALKKIDKQKKPSSNTYFMSNRYTSQSADHEDNSIYEENDDSSGDDCEENDDTSRNDYGENDDSSGDDSTYEGSDDSSGDDSSGDSD